MTIIHWCAHNTRTQLILLFALRDFAHSTLQSEIDDNFRMENVINGKYIFITSELLVTDGYILLFMSQTKLIGNTKEYCVLGANTFSRFCTMRLDFFSFFARWKKEIVDIFYGRIWQSTCQVPNNNKWSKEKKNKNDSMGRHKIT